MEAEGAHKPLLVGRGLLMIDDFCRATGLDRATANAMLRDVKVEGLRHPDGRVAGIFDDVLPSADQLRDWGFEVRDDYDPVALRSYVDDSDDDDEVGETGSPSWSMGWDDQP
ncbi:hypothetical protein GCM10009795_004200 [Nocardioides hankookensis]|uniref:Uncharacterized protein n=1 Tax=Nocardioides hankookensis TaxID=443157 RepID=A0ABW1LMN0_9ACTN